VEIVYHLNITTKIVIATNIIAAKKPMGYVYVLVDIVDPIKHKSIRNTIIKIIQLVTTSPPYSENC